MNDKIEKEKKCRKAKLYLEIFVNRLNIIIYSSVLKWICTSCLILPEIRVNRKHFPKHLWHFEHDLSAETYKRSCADVLWTKKSCTCAIFSAHIDHSIQLKYHLCVFCSVCSMNNKQISRCKKEFRISVCEIFSKWMIRIVIIICLRVNEYIHILEMRSILTLIIILWYLCNTLSLAPFSLTTAIEFKVIFPIITIINVFTSIVNVNCDIRVVCNILLVFLQICKKIVFYRID